MDQVLKNRVVGAVVLLAVAAIVLPLVLDGANEDALLADTRLPPPPAVPDAAALLQPPPQDMPQAEAEIAREHLPVEPEAPVIPPVAVAPGPAPVAPVVAPAAAPAPAASAPTPAPDTRLASLAEAWDVQLAALSTIESAERLRAKVAAAGYKARVLRAGNLFKVVVGPELRREDAEQLRTRLAADARVGKPNGMLVRYIP